MSRIYSHTTQDAPEASRPLLEGPLTVFTAYFLTYAQTPIDLPSAAAVANGRG